MNLPDFFLMVPGETLALICLLALLAGAGVWAHLVNTDEVELSADRDALEELGR